MLWRIFSIDYIREYNFNNSENVKWLYFSIGKKCLRSSIDVYRKTGCETI